MFRVAISPRLIALATVIALAPMPLPADYYSYDGAVTQIIKRDRIISIAEDYATLSYYASPTNVTALCTGCTAPDTVAGTKIGTKYVWGGENTTRQYLDGLKVPLTIGNRDTSSGSSYGQCAVGADCSGFVSNAWSSSRQSTSSFPGISDDITWDQLRQGDATNDAGSHIRLFDYFTDGAHTAMLYESTGTGWKLQHRSLARNDDYQPIRYNAGSTQRVRVFAEPEIQYVRRGGTERVEVRWDGEGSTGFRLYQSTDGASWTLIRNTDTLTLSMRTCIVSGLLPDHTYYYRMTSVNGGVETGYSNIVAQRLDSWAQPKILLVDGYDRYRDQATGTRNNLLARYAGALAANGLGFDFCKNEVIVDEQVVPEDYEAIVWMSGEESTFDEAFSWPEQMHLQEALQAGKRLFVSGTETAWDLDNKADSTTYKNGSRNDRHFCNNYLRASYVADDAGTYNVQGTAGTIFAGMSFSFDNGTQGTYDVVFPDTINPSAGAAVGMTFVGGTGGNACVYATSPTSGTVVNMTFPFETVYPETTRNDLMDRVIDYFNMPPQPPTIEWARQQGTDSIEIAWQGNANAGWRLWRKVGAGAWAVHANETTLGAATRSYTMTGAVPGTQYQFKVQALGIGVVSSDSDVMICSVGSTGHKILVVEGYDRWNGQHSGSNHALLGNYADALTANGCRYDSCTNESVVEGDVDLSDYSLVMWMCGAESTESETFSDAEQLIVQLYLAEGGRLFASGSEIGWDLEARAGALNTYANGSANDLGFYRNYLCSQYVADNSGSYAVTGSADTPFAGLSFNFDDGTHGIYAVPEPDVVTPANAQTSTVLSYGTGATAAVGFRGTVPGGLAPCRMLCFAFPFETIYNVSARTSVMTAVLDFMGPICAMQDDDHFTTDVSNMTPGGTTGWTPSGENTPGRITLDYSEPTHSLRVSVSSAPGIRISGWMTGNSEWLPCSAVGSNNYVRARFYVWSNNQSSPGDSNQIPNLRMRVNNRFAVNSMLEVFNHLAGDTAGTSFGRELRPASDPEQPSLYRVDLDPVDVPALTGSEGVGRAFEAYSLEPQENGVLALTESSIGTYATSALPNSVTPAKVYSVSASDAGDLRVLNSLTDITIQKLFASTYEPDPSGTGMPEYAEGTFGVTLDSRPVATDRVGIITREFWPGDNLAQRVRIEEGRQYKIRWHVTSSRNANVQSQMRLRARSLKFMWSQKYEVGGAWGTNGSANNTIAQQALPGVGTMNPDQRTPGENGGWYTMLVHSPMSCDIRPETPGGIGARMPYTAAQPGPGVNSASGRDLKLGFDLFDTLSGGANKTLEAGLFTLDTIEVRVYDLVPEF